MKWTGFIFLSIAWLPLAACNQVTPDPAEEAKAQVLKDHPDLGVEGSKFNKAFVDLYNHHLKTSPEMFQSPQWPIALAKEASALLGITPTPKPWMTTTSSILNTTPYRTNGRGSQPRVTIGTTPMPH